MTHADGTPDPGDPEATDEEAMNEEFVEDSPVAPEEVAVDESTAETGLVGTEADSVDDASVADVADGGAAAEEPVDELTAARTEVEERTEDLKRVTAEFANYRRRVDRDRLAATEDAKGAVVSELLPLLDDLERARQHGDVENGPLKAFSDKLAAVLTSQGVEEYGAEGDPFDPQIHEAVQDESDGDDQKVGTVLRKGYKLGSRVLRSAMVIVN